RDPWESPAAARRDGRSRRSSARGWRGRFRAGVRRPGGAGRAERPPPPGWRGSRLAIPSPVSPRSRSLHRVSRPVLVRQPSMVRYPSCWDLLPYSGPEDARQRGPESRLGARGVHALVAVGKAPIARARQVSPAPGELPGAGDVLLAEVV